MKKILFTLILLISFSSFGQAEFDYHEKLKALGETAYEKYLAGDYISAAADYKKITEQYDPKFESDYQFYISIAWFYSGLIKLVNDDCSNAIIDFNKSIKLDPSFKPAYNSRATAHICTGDFQGAIKDCEAVIKLDPLFASAYDQMIYSKAILNLDYCDDYKTSVELKLDLPDRGVDFKQCN